ncbi:MAG: tetratricopeptide repeat protein [bacterium]
MAGFAHAYPVPAGRSDDPTVSAAVSPPQGVRVSGDAGNSMDVDVHTMAEYEAAYYYALSCLADLQGDTVDQVELLRRAQASDPDSELLASERAVALTGLGRTEEATLALAAALGAHPKNLDLRRSLAGLYHKLGEDARARALFLGKGGRDPRDPDFLRSLVALDIEDGNFVSAEHRLNILMADGGGVDDRDLLGLCFQRMDRWKDAARVYRTVLAVDPGRDATWEQLSACDEAAGSTATAKADLLAGLKAVAQSPLLADQLGRLLYQSEDYAGAERAFGRLVTMDPSNAHALFYRGLSRLKLGRYRQAERDLRASQRLQSGDPDQAGALALALLLQKKYAEAGRELERVVKLDPRAERAWAELVLVDERDQRPTLALKVLRRGLKALPDDRELTLLLARACEDRGDLTGAVAALRKALALGEDGNVRFELATLLDKLGRFKAAEKELDAVVAEDPRDAEALNYLGYSWVDRGEQLAQAEALIRRALALDPGNPYYLDSLGWALHRQGRDADALKDLSKASSHFAASSDLNEAVVFDHLAQVEARLGNTMGARRAADQASKIRARAGAERSGVENHE